MHTTSTWRKAKASGIGNCVEVRTIAGSVDIRDSKNPDAAYLHLSTPVFRAWIAHLKETSAF